MEVAINARMADVITSNTISVDNPEGFRYPSDLDGVIEDFAYVASKGRVRVLGHSDTPFSICHPS